MNILFVHEVDYVAKIVYEIHEFPEALVHAGHRVLFYDFEEERKHFFNLKRRHDFLSRVRPECDVEVVHARYIGFGLARRFSTLFWSYSDLKAVIKEAAIDVVVLYAVPTFGMQALLAAKEMQVPIIYRALDLSSGIRNTKLNFIIKLIEKQIYRHVNFISANNFALLEYCQKHNETSGEVNPPILDLTKFKPHESIKESTKLSLELGIKADDKVVCFIGTFFPFAGLIEFVDNLKIERFEKVKFLFIGGGGIEDSLKEKIREKELQDFFILTGFVPYAELTDYLKLADIFINTMPNNLVSDLALPHKVFQYLSTGKPVISTRLAGLSSFIGKDAGVHWVDNIEELTAKITDLIANPEVLSSENQLEFLNRIFGNFQPEISFEEMLIRVVRNYN